MWKDRKNNYFLRPLPNCGASKTVAFIAGKKIQQPQIIFSFFHSNYLSLKNDFKCEIAFKIQFRPTCFLKTVIPWQCILGDTGCFRLQAIKVLWRLQFFIGYRTLSLKFQKAWTKIEVVLSLPVLPKCKYVWFHSIWMLKRYELHVHK